MKTRAPTLLAFHASATRLFRQSAAAFTIWTVVVPGLRGQVSLPNLPGYTFTTISSFGSATGSQVEVSAINDAGQYIGNANPAMSPGYLVANGMVTHLVVPGYGSPYGSQVRGISDTGVVVGSVGYNSSNQGFTYNIATGTYTILPTPAGEPYFGAYAISSNGSNIVGWCHPASAIDVAYEYVGGAFVALNVPGPYTYASGVNDNNWVVGWYYPNGGYANINSLGYVLSPSAQLTQISIPGAYGLGCAGVNDKNVIVGDFGYNSSIEQEGFLITAGGTYYQLQVPGAIQTSIEGINDQGVITGTYEASDGKFYGFIGSPVPEPSILALILLGLATLAARGRRPRNDS